MDLERYPITSHKDHLSYEFVSTGQNGSFKIVVKYQKAYPGLYNLAFGDWIEGSDSINSHTKINNRDRDKIIATVASTVSSFLDIYPGSIYSGTR